MQRDGWDDEAELRIYLLGGFGVERADRAGPKPAWQRRGAVQTLVKLLALAPGHRLHRDQVLDLIWPDLEPDAADRSLRKVLHYARHALQPELTQGRASRYLLLQDGILSLAAGLVVVDVDRFRVGAQEALGAGEPERLEEALRLYTGELLPEDRYEDWAAPHRAELSETYVQLLLRLAGELTERHEYDAAVDRLREALVVDPTREDIHRALMRAYALGGSIHAALRQYAACVDVLRRELDAAPDEETERLRVELASNRIALPETGPQPRPAAPRVLFRSTDTPFIGRGPALELLAESLDRAVQGAGELTLVGGEAGVGKTRLVREIAGRAYRQDVLVLWGSSYEAEGTTPYGSIVEALEGYLSTLSHGGRTRLVREHPTLERLLPSLSRSEALPLDLVSGGGKSELFASVVQLFRDLGAARPVVLVLDDLHAADSATLELLHRLARVASGNPWLLLGTYREEEVSPGSGLHRLRAALARAGFCRRVDLHRLARPDTEALLNTLLPDGDVPAALRDRLHALSSGNPLFLQELVQTLQERREVELRGGHWQYATPAPSVPGGVRDLVEERVLRLGAHVEDALSAASVTGMEVRFDILLAASGLGIDALLRALDRALDARILEEVGPRYVFRHPLVRAALYDRIPQQRRRHLHGTVGRAVESISPDDVEALAHHFVNSGEDERAIVHLERAGDRAAMVFANEAAIEFYEDAAARAAKRLDMQVYARISGKLGNVLSILGKYAEAEAAYNEALGHAGDPAQRSALWRALARTWEKRGEFGRALGILDAAQAEAQAAGTMLPAAERVDVLVSRAEALLGLARFDEASALARSALAILETEPDEVRQAQVHHVEGRIAGLQGDDAAALEIFKRGLAVAEDAGDMRGMAACLTALAVVATHLGDTESADAYQRRSIQIAERMGDHHTAAIGWNNLGVSAHARGEFELARECYRKSLATREEIDDKQGLAVSWINLGEAALFQGDLDEAEEDCRKSLDLYLEINDAYGIAYVKATRAAVAFNRGNLCDAERCWHESLEIRREIGDGPGVVDCELGLAQVSIAMAKLGEAYHAARRARRTASGRAPELEARAALVQARVRVLEGRTRQAEPLIARAGRLVEEHKLGRLAVHVLLAEASRRLAGHGVAGARNLVAQAEEEARRRGLHLEAGQARHLLDRVPEGGDSLARESRWLPAAIYV